MSPGSIIAADLVKCHERGHLQGLCFQGPGGTAVSPQDKGPRGAIYLEVKEMKYFVPHHLVLILLLYPDIPRFSLQENRR